MKKLIVALLLGISAIASTNVLAGCPGAPNTFVYTQAWGDGARKFSQGLNDSDVQIIKLTIPADTPLSATKKYSMSGGEWKDNGVPRDIKVSSIPCDFKGEFTGKSFAADFYVNDAPVILKYKNLPRFKFPQPTFKPGDTVYINIRNDVGCYGSCNIFWQFSGWPAK